MSILCYPFLMLVTDSFSCVVTCQANDAQLSTMVAEQVLLSNILFLCILSINSFMRKYTADC